MAKKSGIIQSRMINWILKSYVIRSIDAPPRMVGELASESSTEGAAKRSFAVTEGGAMQSIA